MTEQRSATSIANKVNAGTLSLDQSVGAFIANIKEREPTLNALITGPENTAITRQCESLEKRLKNGEALPLAGVPVIVKDNISTQGIRTTCASKMLEDFVPLYDATVVRKLKQAGAIILGKANCDEFAMGSSNEFSYFGVAKNPWDHTRVPGGSSGGSAAAVAAGMAPLALGSDTGGSIRLPAALCGVIGLKPTYGSVSRYGLVAYASSLDQIGPFAKTAADLALVYDVLCGFDEQDATSAQRTYHPTDLLAGSGLEGKKIGLIAEISEEGIDGAVCDALDAAVKTYEALGAVVERISIPELSNALCSYYVIATAEVSSNLARFDGVRYGYRDKDSVTLNDLYANSRSKSFGDEVKKRIMLGTFALASGYYDAYYGKAKQVRNYIKSKIQTRMQTYDFLISPTCPTTAWKLGDKIDDPMKMYVTDICTITANLCGLPAVSHPAGFDKHGLPIGVQLMGRDFQDAELLNAVHLFESERPEIWQRSAYDS